MATLPTISNSNGIGKSCGNVVAGAPKTNEYKKEAVSFLKHTFHQLSVFSIQRVYHHNNFVFTPTFNALEAIHEIAKRQGLSENERRALISVQAPCLGGLTATQCIVMKYKRYSKPPPLTNQDLLRELAGKWLERRRSVFVSCFYFTFLRFPSHQSLLYFQMDPAEIEGTQTKRSPGNGAPLANNRVPTLHEATGELRERLIDIFDAEIEGTQTNQGPRGGASLTHTTPPQLPETTGEDTIGNTPTKDPLAVDLSVARMIASQPSPPRPVEFQITCECCYGDYSFEEMAQCDDGHLFCKTCVQQYVREQFYGNNRSDFPCMSGDGCAADFSLRATLENVLSPKLLKNIEDHAFRSSVAKAKVDGLWQVQN